MGACGSQPDQPRPRNVRQAPDMEKLKLDILDYADKSKCYNCQSRRFDDYRIKLLDYQLHDGRHIEYNELCRYYKDIKTALNGNHGTCVTCLRSWIKCCERDCEAPAQIMIRYGQRIDNILNYHDGRFEHILNDLGDIKKELITESDNREHRCPPCSLDNAKKVREKRRNTMKSLSPLLKIVNDYAWECAKRACPNMARQSISERNVKQDLKERIKNYELLSEQAVEDELRKVFKLSKSTCWDCYYKGAGRNPYNFEYRYID